MAAPAAQAEAKAEKPRTINVTYIPKDGGDPHTTKVGGFIFRAHMPVAIPVNAAIAATLRRDKEVEDGSIRTQGIETKMSLIELLKNNPWFLVEGHEQAQTKAGRIREPSNPDEYRGYALRWIAAAETAGEMQTRWKSEERLRETCGVTEGELSGIMPFYWARLEVLGGAVAA